VKPLPLAGAGLLGAYLWWRRRRLGKLELVGLGLVIAGLVAYGLGLVRLPNIEKIVEDLGTALGPYMYALVGVMAFLETGAFVGLVAPGETFILVGGLVAGQGQISIVVLIAIVWTAAVAGDVTSFFLGRRLGRDFMLRHGPRVKITPERFEMVEGFYGRHGGKAVFLGRFVGLIRAVSPFVAGSTHMPLRRFLPYDILGAGIWGAGLCVLGWVFWRSFDKVTTYASRGLFVIGTLIAVVGGGIAAYRWLQVPANRERAHAWLHEQAQRPLLRPFAAVARPLVWRVAVPLWHWLAGPVRFTFARLTPGDLGLELTTLLAIAVVGAYGYIVLERTTGLGPTALDARAFDVAARFDAPLFVDGAKIVTAFGSLAVVGLATVLAAGFLLWCRRGIEAGVLVFGLAITYVLVHEQKAAEDRPRPSGMLIDAVGSSFPSGHAAYSITWIALAVALARAVPWMAGRAAVLTTAVVLAAAIGLTRVELRAHYLTDVLAGWALGATVFALCGIVGLVVGHVRHNHSPP
jgi:membrane protein DedA with SNARE-associated domain/membrane-associated phospholipid phosphatase